MLLERTKAVSTLLPSISSGVQPRTTVLDLLNFESG
jgi:hypothetical protein